MKAFFKHTLIYLVMLCLASSVYARGGAIGRVTTAATTSAETSAALAQESAASTDRTFAAAWQDHLNGAFVGFEGIDIRQMPEDTEYLASQELDTGAVKFNRIPTGYQWAWRVWLGVNLTGNDDVTASWMQIRLNDTRVINHPSNVLSLPRWSLRDIWENINGRYTSDLDEVYAVWGHRLKVNDRWELRWAAGAEYARINNTLTVTADVPTLAFLTFGYKGKSRLNSMGPRLELDAIWHVPYGCGFAIFAKTNLALLAGKRTVEMQNINLNPVVFIAIPDSFYDTDYTVVPKIGMRVGGSYSHVFGQAGAEGMTCCRLTTFTLELGWMEESWIHAIARAEQSNIGTFSYNVTDAQNFNVQGFFLGLNINSDWL